MLSARLIAGPMSTRSGEGVWGELETALGARRQRVSGGARVGPLVEHLIVRAQAQSVMREHEGGIFAQRRAEALLGLRVGAALALAVQHHALVGQLPRGHV